MIGLGSDKNVKAPRATFCADPNPNSPGMIVLMMMVMVRLAWHDGHFNGDLLKQVCYFTCGGIDNPRSILMQFKGA